MLMNAEVEISSAMVAEMATGLKVPGKFERETGLGTWGKISRATHQPRHPLGHSIQNLAGCVARRHAGDARGKGRQARVPAVRQIALLEALNLII